MENQEMNLTPLLRRMYEKTKTDKTEEYLYSTIPDSLI